MTRKHFIAFADDIRKTGEWYTKVQRQTILRMLARSNPQFDKARFCEAAGWEQTDV